MPGDTRTSWSADAKVLSERISKELWLPCESFLATSVSLTVVGVKCKWCLAKSPALKRHLGKKKHQAVNRLRVFRTFPENRQLALITVITIYYHILELYIVHLQVSNANENMRPWSLTRPPEVAIAFLFVPPNTSNL